MRKSKLNTAMMCLGFVGTGFFLYNMVTGANVANKVGRSASATVKEGVMV